MRERGHPTALQASNIMRRFLLSLFVWLAVCSHAWASFPPVADFEYTADPMPSTQWVRGGVAACQAWIGAANSAYGWGASFSAFNEASALCQGTSPGGGVGVNMQKRGAPALCPANSTLEGGQCTCKVNFDEVGGTCVPHVNQCTGKSGAVNMTIGWQRTPNIGSSEPLLGTNPFSGGGSSMCVSGCTTDVSPTEPCPGCKAQVSQTPNDQGLYRVSAEFMGKATGQECTAGAGDAPVTPDNSKDPPCPGYVGEVNGVKGCYGTAAKPVVTTPPSGPAAVLPKTPGNPPAGASSPGAPTPAAGAGGSAGGPAGAAGAPAGSGGTGTVAGAQNGSGRVGTQSGTEQAACGAPGQPPCKIDETGTQEGVGTSFNEGKGLLDQNRQTAEEAMNAAQQIQAPTWSFSFQLPSGCSSYQVASFKGVAFTMNPCTYQSTIHDLMSMIWAAVTAFCLIGMVGRTIREA